MNRATIIRLGIEAGLTGEGVADIKMVELERFAALVEAETLKAHQQAIEAAVPGTHATQYTLDGCDPHNQIHITQVLQMSGPALWAVRRHGTCLNKDLEWEWEPMPSSRDEDFLSRCRFSTPIEAMETYSTSTQNMRIPDAHKED